MVGASGLAQAQSPEEDARTIIAEFCETIADDAEEAQDRLADVVEDQEECVDDFRDCRDGGLFGNDPLVECLSDGIECSARAAEDKAQACGEYKEDFSDAYEQALRQARRKDVEDDVQDFFNNRTRARRLCLRPAIQVARVCADIAE